MNLKHKILRWLFKGRYCFICQKVYKNKQGFSRHWNLKHPMIKYSFGVPHTRKDKYVTEEHPMPGVTLLSMNSKGFYEEFAKPLIKMEKKNK